MTLAQAAETAATTGAVAPAWSKDGAYVVLGAGSAKGEFEPFLLDVFDSFFGLASDRVTATGSATAYTLALGYRGRYFGGELGYSTTSGVPYRVETASETLNGEWKANGLSLDVLGFLPLDERYELFGRLGFNSIDGSSTAQSPNGTRQYDFDVAPFSGGLGAQFFIDERIAGRLEWRQQGAFDGAVRSVLIQLVYRF
jgi:hypothetical protein